MDRELPPHVAEPLKQLVESSLPSGSRVRVERGAGNDTWDVWAEVPQDGTKILSLSDEVVDHLEPKQYLSELTEIVRDEFPKAGKRLVRLREHRLRPGMHEIHRGE